MGSEGLWGSVGGGGGEQGEVKKAVEQFFLFQSQPPPPPNTCDLCLKGDSPSVAALSEALSEELVGVVLHALLVPQGEKGRTLTLCEECTASLTSLADLYFHLDDLRREFNDLRRRVGKMVIVGALGREEEEWEEWKTEVREVEDLFPSCVGVKGVSSYSREEEEEEEIVGATVKEERLVEEVEEEEQMEQEETEEMEPQVEQEELSLEEHDPKLKMMKAVVVCERINEKLCAGPAEEAPPILFRQDLDICGSSVASQDESESFSDESTCSSTSKETTPLLPRPCLKKEVEEEDFEICAARMYPCPLCDKTYLRSDHVKRHIRTFHDNPQPPRQPHACLPCNLTFPTKRLALRHANNLHKEPQVSSNPSKSKKSKKPSKKSKKPKPKSKKPSKKSYSTSSRLLRLRHPPKPTPHAHTPRGSEQHRRQCSLCLHVFTRPDHLRRHAFKVHSVVMRTPAKIPCTHCDVSFSNSLIFRRHQLTTHFLGSVPEGDAQCPFCLQFFYTRRRLDVHQMEVHFEGRAKLRKGQKLEDEVKGRKPVNIRCFLCWTSSPTFSSAAELKAHEESDAHRAKVRSKVSVHCNVCRLNLKGDTEALEIHLKGPEHQKVLDSLGNFNEKTYCIPCRLNFSNRFHLYSHTGGISHERRVAVFRDNQMAEKPVGVALKCEACPKVFDFQSALDRHVQCHHAPNGYSCKFCEMKFTHLRDFQSHRFSHKDEIPKDHVCAKCGKSFELEKYLLRHNRVAHDGVISACDRCGKSFPTPVSLERHVKQVHLAGGGKNSGFYSCNCPHCGVSFKRPQACRKHRFRSHRKEYLRDSPHPCLTCFHVFSSKKELLIHKKAHAHLRCATCGKQFKTRADLNDHLESHEETEDEEDDFE